jgi:hypothetical protein
MYCCSGGGWAGDLDRAGLAGQYRQHAFALQPGQQLTHAVNKLADLLLF